MNLNLNLIIYLSVVCLSTKKNNWETCKGTQSFLWTCETGASLSGALVDQTWTERLHDQK